MNEPRLTGTRALLVEDEPLLRRRLTTFLEKQGVEVTAVGTIAEARRALADLEFDLALLDVHLPDGSSLDLLAEKALPAGIATVIMTAEGGVKGAVEAMRLGAADYLVKPFDPDELAVRLIRARRDRQARRGDSFQREQGGGEFFFHPGLAAVKEQLEKIVAADRRLQQNLSPVLIEGETGTGKTSLARWIHRHGPRADGLLIEVNCSALPETLAESELFGHERGAFTDAREGRMGLMEAAEGGTLFLDELPSLSAPIQAKMLTAIEDRAIRRVGGNRTVGIDVRIIAATSSDLRAMVAAGKFREDLLHRLDLFRVKLPPLRERGSDLFELAEALAARIARNYGLPAAPIPALGRASGCSSIPGLGNVRELAHEIERSLVFDQDRPHPSPRLARTAGASAADSGNAWLNPNFVFPEEGFSLEAAIDELAARAMRQSGDNISWRRPAFWGCLRDFLRYRLKNRVTWNKTGK